MTESEAQSRVDYLRKQTQNEDVPWFTEQELEDIVAIEMLALAESGYTPAVQPWQEPLRQRLAQQRNAEAEAQGLIKYNSYKADVRHS